MAPKSEESPIYVVEVQNANDPGRFNEICLVFTVASDAIWIGKSPFDHVRAHDTDHVLTPGHYILYVVRTKGEGHKKHRLYGSGVPFRIDETGNYHTVVPGTGMQ